MTEGVERRVVACDRRVDRGGVLVRRGVESRRMVLIGFCGCAEAGVNEGSLAAVEATSGWDTVASIFLEVQRDWFVQLRPYCTHLDEILETF